MRWSKHETVKFQMICWDQSDRLSLHPRFLHIKVPNIANLCQVIVVRMCIFPFYHCLLLLFSAILRFNISAAK